MVTAWKIISGLGRFVAGLAGALSFLWFGLIAFEFAARADTKSDLVKARADLDAANKRVEISEKDKARLSEALAKVTGNRAEAAKAEKKAAGIRDAARSEVSDNAVDAGIASDRLATIQEKQLQAQNKLLEEQERAARRDEKRTDEQRQQNEERKSRDRQVLWGLVAGFAALATPLAFKEIRERSAAKVTLIETIRKEELEEKRRGENSRIHKEHGAKLDHAIVLANSLYTEALEGRLEAKREVLELQTSHGTDTKATQAAVTALESQLKERAARTLAYELLEREKNAEEKEVQAEKET